MRKTFLFAGSIVFGLAIIIKAGILDSLVAFILAGEIPGTHVAIPSSLMLLGTISVVWLLVFHFALTSIVRPTTHKRRAAKRQTARKKQMPKRRYSEI